VTAPVSPAEDAGFEIRVRGKLQRGTGGGGRVENNACRRTDKRKRSSQVDNQLKGFYRITDGERSGAQRVMLE
jgi:hypothetical protein